MPSRTSRIVVVAVCTGAIVANLVIVFHLAYLWSALKWEPETEWDEWRMNGVRVFVFLVAGYFTYAFLAALVGLLGALQVLLRPYYSLIICAHSSTHSSAFLPSSASSGTRPSSTLALPSPLPSSLQSALADQQHALSSVNNFPANRNFFAILQTPDSTLKTANSGLKMPYSSSFS